MMINPRVYGDGHIETLRAAACRRRLGALGTSGSSQVLPGRAPVAADRESGVSSGTDSVTWQAGLRAGPPRSAPRGRHTAGVQPVGRRTPSDGDGSRHRAAPSPSDRTPSACVTIAGIGLRLADPGSD
eukprot:1072-Hanusia_phi.AAC.3